MDFSVPHVTPQDWVIVDMCAFCFHGNVSKQSGLGQGTHAVHTMALSDFTLWRMYSGGPIRCETDCCKDRGFVKTSWNHAQSEGVEGF